MKRLDYYWYHPGAITWVLLPLSGLFCLLSGLRRILYRLSILKHHKLPVPVIVVGNITVGGTGKTPFVILLTKHLKQQGYRPGIISRGYGGHAFDNAATDKDATDKDATPRLTLAVTASSDPRQVGDEPVLVAQRCDCPVRISPNRVAAAQALLTETDCNVIISDDGLQHYALERDLEIVVIDNQRRFGNRHCLPAGPLREPVSRLKSVDYVVGNGGAQAGETRMQLTMSGVTAVNDPLKQRHLSDFNNQTVHAIAGIGNPRRFFSQLNESNIDTVNHAFADHHDFNAADIIFDDDLPVLMTEKDAVKCRAFAGPQHWFVPVTAECDGAMLNSICDRLKEIHG